MLKVISFINSSLWSWFFLPCTLVCGFILSVRLRGIQFRKLPDALRLPFISSSADGGGISSAEAASTALASTVGTGNVIGTAQAIAMGGVGAVFWMWVAAALAMVIKYAEIYYTLHFRNPERSGGPMQYIEKALGKGGAVFYAACAVGASLGMGCMVQANGCVCAFMSAVGLYVQLSAKQAALIRIAFGILLSTALILILSGGIKTVGKASEKLVPLMSIGFIILCIAVLAVKANAVIPAFSAIFSGAFSPRAEVGGAMGACIQWGLRRGAFSNEAGLGSAGLAHAGVLNEPSKEALWGIFEVFADTVVICSAVALVILCSGCSIPYGTSPGAELMAEALGCVFRGKTAVVLFSASLVLFAFTSILGWSAYTQLCAKYLFGFKAMPLCIILTSCAAFFGTVMQIETVWIFADLFNVLMSVPNYLALFVLTCRYDIKST